MGEPSQGSKNPVFVKKNVQNEKKPKYGELNFSKREIYPPKAAIKNCLKQKKKNRKEKKKKKIFLPPSSHGTNETKGPCWGAEPQWGEPIPPIKINSPPLKPKKWKNFANNGAFEGNVTKEKKTF